MIPLVESVLLFPLSSLTLVCVLFLFNLVFVIVVILPCLVPTCLALPWLGLACLALPCLVLPCLALLYLALPPSTLPCPTLSCPTLPCLMLWSSCVVLCCRGLSLLLSLLLSLSMSMSCLVHSVYLFAFKDVEETTEYDICREVRIVRSFWPFFVCNMLISLLWGLGTHTEEHFLTSS